LYTVSIDVEIAVLNLDRPDIADVTNFVHPGTPLDEEASQRATSVYLVGQRIDMLPKPLTEGITVGIHSSGAFLIEFDNTQVNVNKYEWK
jgi:hypothetical protein